MSVIERKTKETDIKAELNVYGSSKAEIDSGIGFFRPYADGTYRSRRI